MKKIIFDVDDTLWSLNKKICNELDIPYENITTFSVHENPFLTERERQQMLSKYSDPNSFKNITWFDGIEQIENIKDADIYLNSNSSNELCSAEKRQQLRAVLNIPDDHITINTTGNKKKDIVKKSIDEDTFIFVDDSPHNVSMSPAKYNIMICTPWNQSENGKTIVKDKNVLYCKTLIEAINLVQKLINNERS